MRTDIYENPNFLATLKKQLEILHEYQKEIIDKWRHFEIIPEYVQKVFDNHNRKIKEINCEIAKFSDGTQIKIINQNKIMENI